MIRSTLFVLLLVLVASADAKNARNGGGGARRGNGGGASARGGGGGGGRGGNNDKARNGGNNDKARNGGNNEKTRNGGNNEKTRGNVRNGGSTADVRAGNNVRAQAIATTDAGGDKRGNNRNGGRNNNRMNNNMNSNMNSNMSGGSSSKSYDDDSGSRDLHNCYNVRVKVTNLARGQPLSEFYVHAHNELSTPLYELGEPATAPFAVLAEDGNARDLVNFYNGNSRGVYADSIRIEGGSEPLEFGDSLMFRVEVEERFQYISFASMAINTNDVFIGVAGMKVSPGTRMTIFVPGYDAGTEMNNELCEYIPGPACESDSGNLRTEEGEGVVYISPGISGFGMDENRTATDLNPAVYDWRNPMAKIEVMAEEIEEDDDDDW